MIEFDQSDKDIQNKMPPSEISNNSVDITELGQKRLREETSEDEELNLLSKKLCTSVDETISEKYDIKNTSEINGIIEEIKEDTKDTSIDTKKDKNKLELEESTNEIVKDSCVEISDIKNNEISINNATTIEKESESNVFTDTKQQESISTELEADLNVENTTINKIQEQEEEEDIIKSKKKHRKFQIEDAEVVEGLELSVECASDKDSSSSESEDGKDKKLIPKTIIIKAKPNDSELDVSSSEADKSDLQDTSEIKSKQTIKKGKKKSRTSFSKTKNTDSEENDDDVSDEDYSPRTKKKLKKTLTNKKTPKIPTESKKGRGRVKKGTKKPTEKEDGEDENSNITEDLKSEENTFDVKSVKSKSETESDSEDTSKNGKKKRNIRPEDNKKIQLLKKYIRIAGIHVKSYNDLWADCTTNAARIMCLKELLTKNGINGRPTVEKCKKAKEKNERLKDVAELSTSNIISEGRVTRAQRNKDTNKEPTKTPGSPTKHREARNTFKRVLTVVDSDSE